MLSKAIIIATIAAVVAAQAHTAEVVEATVTFLNVHDHHLRQTAKPCIPGAVDCLQAPMVAGQVGPIHIGHPPNTFNNDKRQAVKTPQIALTATPPQTTVMATRPTPTIDQKFQQDQSLSNLPVPPPMPSSTKMYSKSMAAELSAAFASNPASQASVSLADLKYLEGEWEKYKSNEEHIMNEAKSNFEMAKHHIGDLKKAIKSEEKRLAHHNAKGFKKNSGTSVQLPVSLLGISLVTALAFGGLASVL